MGIHRNLESKTFKSQKVESPRQTLGKAELRFPREVSILSQRRDQLLLRVLLRSRGSEGTKKLLGLAKFKVISDLDKRRGGIL